MVLQCSECKEEGEDSRHVRTVIESEVHFVCCCSGGSLGRWSVVRDLCVWSGGSRGGCTHRQLHRQYCNRVPVLFFGNTELDAGVEPVNKYVYAP